jgi:hypothetical protein
LSAVRQLLARPAVVVPVGSARAIVARVVAAGCAGSPAFSWQRVSVAPGVASAGPSRLAGTQPDVHGWGAAMRAFRHG